MAKKGKKGGGKKKADPQEADLMTEVEKELFQIQISDLMQRVERMKTRCLELEMSNEEYQKRYEQLDEDRADIIAYLKRMLQEKEDEVLELKERIEGLEQTLKQDREAFEEKVRQLEYDFKVMQEQLTSEIKLLTGKLNSLEEFRLQRDDLMKKFKVQEQEMEEQEQRHKRTLYEVEKKFVIGKDKLKREMEAKLLQLSMDFQDATHIRIAATTHRTIRENIAINNELEKMILMEKLLREENEAMRDRDRKLILEVKLREEERDKVIYKNMVQIKLVKRLTTEYERMVGTIGTLQNSAQRAGEFEKLLQETRDYLQKQERHIALLEEQLLSLKYANNEFTTKLLESEMDIYRLQKIIHGGMLSIKAAMEVQIEPGTDEAALSRRQDLLSNLLLLLNTADIPDFESQEKEMETRAKTSEIYVIGDVGLIPKTSSELRAEITESRYTIGSQTVVEPVKPPSEEGSEEEVGSQLSESSEEKKSEKSGESSESDTETKKKPATESGEGAKEPGDVTESAQPQAEGEATESQEVPAEGAEPQEVPEEGAEPQDAPTESTGAEVPAEPSDAQEVPAEGQEVAEAPQPAEASEPAESSEPAGTSEPTETSEPATETTE